MKAVSLGSVTMKAAVPRVFNDPSLTAVQVLVQIVLARWLGSKDRVRFWKAHSFVSGSDKRWV